MRSETPPPRVLAIDPTSRGFGFAVLEGPGELVDWGVREIRHRDDGARDRKMVDLLEHYRPDFVVTEDCRDAASRRGPRARAALAGIALVAARREILHHAVSITTVRGVFGVNGGATKQSTAEMIAEHLPALALRLPPKRKPWMSEAERMAIFDAVALALTFYHHLDADLFRTQA